MSPSWLAFIESYLAPREAVVVVEGARSEPYIIADMVFQGSARGTFVSLTFPHSQPALAMTKSASQTISRFSKRMDNADIVVELHTCQESVNDWGWAHLITFDKSKEEFIVIHHRFGRETCSGCLVRWLTQSW